MLENTTECIRKYKETLKGYYKEMFPKCCSVSNIQSFFIDSKIIIFINLKIFTHHDFRSGPGICAQNTQ